MRHECQEHANNARQHSILYMPCRMLVWHFNWTSWGGKRFLAMSCRSNIAVSLCSNCTVHNSMSLVSNVVHANDALWRVDCLTYSNYCKRARRAWTWSLFRTAWASLLVKRMGAHTSTSSAARTCGSNAWRKAMLMYRLMYRRMHRATVCYCRLCTSTVQEVKEFVWMLLAGVIGLMTLTAKPKLQNNNDLELNLDCPTLYTCVLATWFDLFLAAA